MYQPKLSHSQNFLQDASLVQRLVDSSSIGPQDLVVEIGPGEGIITRILAERAKAVFAVEADRDLFERLTRLSAGLPNITAVNTDFLTWPLPRTRFKVFSNIPFNITADVIRRLIDAENPPEDAFLVAQREAAYKYAGTPWQAETLVSILHKPWFTFDVTHRFRATDFRPSPRVEIVLLRIKRLDTPLVADPDSRLFADFVTHGFTSLKPSLKKAFKNVFGHIQFLRLATEFGFSQTATPRDLTFEQWLGMFRYLVGSVDRSKWAVVAGASERLGRQQASLQKVHRTRSATNWRQNINLD